MSSIDETLNSVQDGSIDELSCGDKIFKLHSHPNNPIVRPEDFGQIWYEDGITKIGSIVNCGSILFNGRVILTPRVHSEYQRGQFFDETLGRERFFFRNYISKIWILTSDDGINFERFDDGLIKGDGEDHRDFIYGIEDVRILQNNELYWLIGCGKVIPPFQGTKGNAGDRIAFYSTTDFQNYTYHGIVPEIEARNTVIFPESISGQQYIFLRFDGDIYIDILKEGLEQLQNPSQFSIIWNAMYQDRKNTLFMKKGSYPHEMEKIGPGPPPVKTEKGWLFIYHGVGEMSSDLGARYGVEGKINRGYSVCAALLDLNDPTNILCRTKHPLYIPSKPWELF
ncbi:MAG: glycoside hydrolase family 130 protein, partial [Candidatus Kariarchaeaceae archaeon]